MTLHIVFVEPEIPPNTGNVARTCAATGANLHLVKPIAFEMTDKALRRAGLDYWPYVNVQIYENIYEFMEKNQDKRKFYVSTKGAKTFSENKYKDEDMFLFGSETRGLDKRLLRENEGATIRIPMKKDTRLRSLNLANSANIVLYEALRQLNYPNLI